ncbi:MAG: IclR family transcriptional regulator [Proteobacteria bacterium]|nr:IclR family transcriptional regulator [Pseudomonadota bacterium]
MEPEPRQSRAEPLGAATVDKAVDVLFCLQAASEPTGVTALARQLDLPKSSVHRLLSALCRRGLVERDERSRYRLGFGLVTLGQGALLREPLVLAARPVLEAEARELGETLFLVCARAGELMILDKAEGTGFLRATPRVGEIVPAHATAVGKLYLAFAPDELADPAALEAFTERTAVTAEALAPDVERAGRQGWAVNVDEWIPGLSVLAAPLVCDGRLLGTLALAAATPRLEALGGEALAPRLVEAAAKIVARLQGRTT